MLPIINTNKKITYDWRANGFYSELLCMYISILYAMEQDWNFRLTINENCAYFLDGYEQFFDIFWRDDLSAPDQEQEELVYNGNSLFSYLYHKHIFLEKPIPTLDILEGASLFDRMKMLTEKIYLINTGTKEKIDQKLTKLNLPDKFCGIHIRKGDKIDPRFKEAEDITIQKYVQAYKDLGNKLPIFISTDDIRTITTFEKLTDQNVFHVVPEWMTGSISAQSIPARQRHMYKDGHLTADYDTLTLLTSAEALCKSEVFIGTFTSNLSKFIPLRHKNHQQCYSLDKPSMFNNHGIPLLRDCGYYL